MPFLEILGGKALVNSICNKEILTVKLKLFLGKLHCV